MQNDASIRTLLLSPQWRLKSRLGFAAFVISLISTYSAYAESDQSAQAVLNYQDRRAIFEPELARDGMVASDHFLASGVGADILAQGGNAVDAAVATAFTLAVVLPYAGNLGGGGFALIHEQDRNTVSALDFREVAPLVAHANMFLDAQSNPVPRMSVESTASIGVPGSVAGLLTMLDKHGTITRQAAIAPAIALARQGFDVTPALAQLLTSHARHLYKSPPNRAIFFERLPGFNCLPTQCPFEALRPLQLGDKLIQQDLAKTLQTISNEGIKGFYQGPVAKAILETVNQEAILMSSEDLSGYQVRWREPVRGQYRGLHIASMPPPSSGGVHLLQMLNTLSHFPLKEYGYGSAMTIHLMAEASKRAYVDRAKYLGDPDFVSVPVQQLLSKTYAKQLAQDISLEQATLSISLHDQKTLPAESLETTHLSVVDRWQNMVSLTTTLNLNFGSGWMAPGTGVLLNNEMDDFAIQAGTPNAFGLTGSEANQIAPGKRPLSSMTPTIVFRDGKPLFATGTPGGSRIITIVMQTITNVADHGMNIASAGAVPRMHHQWLPDRIELEPGFSPDTVRILRLLGHSIHPSRAAGRVQSVGIGAQGFLGASDPRSADGAAMGTNIQGRVKK